MFEVGISNVCERSAISSGDGFAYRGVKDSRKATRNFNDPHLSVECSSYPDFIPPNGFSDLIKCQSCPINRLASTEFVYKISAPLAALALNNAAVIEDGSEEVLWQNYQMPCFSLTFNY